MRQNIVSMLFFALTLHKKMASFDLILLLLLKPVHLVHLVHLVHSISVHLTDGEISNLLSLGKAYLWWRKPRVMDLQNGSLNFGNWKYRNRFLHL